MVVLACMSYVAEIPLNPSLGKLRTSLNKGDFTLLPPLLRGGGGIECISSNQ